MDLPAKLASIASKKESRSLDGSSDGSLLEASQPRSEHLDRDAFRLGEFLQNQLEVGRCFLLLSRSCITTRSSFCRWSWRRRKRCIRFALRFETLRSNSSRGIQEIRGIQGIQGIRGIRGIQEIREIQEIHPSDPIAFDPAILRLSPLPLRFLRENHGNPPSQVHPTRSKPRSFENSLRRTHSPPLRRNVRFLLRPAMRNDSERNRAKACERRHALPNPLCRFAITRRLRRRGTSTRTSRGKGR